MSGFPFSRDYLKNQEDVRKKPAPNKKARAVKDVMPDPPKSTQSSNQISLEKVKPAGNNERLAKKGNMKMKIIKRSDVYLIAISTNTTLYISGFVNIGIIKGTCTVNGFSLRPDETFKISSPCWTPAVVLESSKSSTNKKASLSSKLLEKSGGFPLEFGPEKVVLMLSPSDEEWLEVIEDHQYYVPRVGDINHELFKSEDPFYFTDFLRLHTGLIGVAAEFQQLGLSLHQYPTNWIDCMGEMGEIHQNYSKENKFVSTAVCGCKGVGKSTFLRYAVNRYLSYCDAVCIIDLDVGQPEFSPPGTLTLSLITQPVLSTPHMHISYTPELSYFFGDISAKNNPEFMANAISSLFNRYIELERTHRLNFLKRHAAVGNSFELFNMDSEFHYSLPLLINCDGNVRNMGAEIMSLIFQAIQPSHICYLKTPKDDIFQSCKTPSSLQKVFSLHPGQNKKSNIPSVDLRNLRIVSYFLRQSVYLQERFSLQKVKDDVDKTTASSLSSSMLNTVAIRNGAIIDPAGLIASALLLGPQYAVPFDCTKFRVVEGSWIVEPSLTLSAFNASLIGICTAGSSSTSNSTTILRFEEPRLGSQFGLDCVGEAPVTPCISLGIIRYFDIVNCRSIVLSPLPLSPQLVSSSTSCSLYFVRGPMTLPSCLLYVSGFPEFPYLSGEGTGEGSSEIRARPNMKRRNGTQ